MDIKKILHLVSITLSEEEKTKIRSQNLSNMTAEQQFKYIKALAQKGKTGIYGVIDGGKKDEKKEVKR
jgi:hypothetical protein